MDGAGEVAVLAADVPVELQVVFGVGEPLKSAAVWAGVCFGDVREFGGHGSFFALIRGEDTSLAPDVFLYFLGICKLELANQYRSCTPVRQGRYGGCGGKRGI